MKMSISRFIPVIIFLSGIMLLSSAGHASETVSRTKAEARKGSMITLGKVPEQKNFKFNDIKAWLNTDGDWYIQGYINHKKLLCAHYDLGVRFGMGNPGCTNVKWISEEEYVSHLRQCNQARMGHGGGNRSGLLKNNYDKITCAERIIKCKGQCK